jgi:hypothetical protein
MEQCVKQASYEKTTDGTTTTDEGDDKVVITETTTEGETEEKEEVALDSNLPRLGSPLKNYR